MDLNYVCGADKAMQAKLNDEGYDLDTLLLVCKDLFALASDMEMTDPSELQDFIFRLKNSWDVESGTKVEPDMVLYENSRSFPSRLAVESRITGKTYFFKLVSGQGKVDKAIAEYRCEICSSDVSVKRQDAKSHIQNNHDSF